MNLAALIVQLVIVAITGLVFRRLVQPSVAEQDQTRPRWKRLGDTLGTVLLGAALFVPGRLIEAWAERLAGLSERGEALLEPASVIYALLFAAPLEQGLKVLAMAPAWRARRRVSPRAGALFAATSALGFIAAHNVALSWRQPATLLDVGRGLVSVPAHMLFAAAWGWGLERDAQRSRSGRAGGPNFRLAWPLASFATGVVDHLVFGRGAAALGVATLIAAVWAGGAVWAARRLLDEGVVAPSRPGRLSIAPPTLAAVRAALWRSEQPVMVGWIRARRAGDHRSDHRFDGRRRRARPPAGR